MPNVFDPANINRLDSAERRELIPPHGTLSFLGLKKGDTFLDIGAGSGYFAIPAAEITGSSGEVIATDMSSAMLEHLKARSAGLRLTVLESEPHTIPVNDGTADLTFMAFVFHELDNRQAYIGEMKRVTKEEGRIAIIDWAKTESPMGPPADHRIDMMDALKTLMSAGCKIESYGLLNPYQYFITATPR